LYSGDLSLVLKMLLKLILVSALISLCLAKQVTFKDCGSVSGKIAAVNVDPCDVEPCVLHHGANITVGVNFTALTNSATATTVVHGIIAGVPVPFPVPSDCCNNHNLKCPIVANTTDYYHNFVFCSPSYPKLKLVAKWEVQDDKGKDIMCFEVPLVIQD